MCFLLYSPPKLALAKLVQHPHGRVGGCATSSPTSSVTTHRANNLWSGSYFAGSVGAAPLSVVRQYIEQQSRPV
ncbi:transposase [Micromonospora luteifusca]|uniref:transposase n=1 Tax=Micromonospora luteifusca TaxID=709860 RepID=UPI0033A4CF77